MDHALDESTWTLHATKDFVRSGSKLYVLIHDYDRIELFYDAKKKKKSCKQCGGKTNAAFPIFGLCLFAVCVHTYIVQADKDWRWDWLRIKPCRKDFGPIQKSNMEQCSVFSEVQMY